MMRFCGCSKMILKASGKQGVPQGGVISPLLSNLYLNEVDKMLERAKEVTRHERWTAIEYARFADDLVVLVDAHPRQRWLRQAVEKRLREELAKLQVEVNEEKSRRWTCSKGRASDFLGLSSVVSGVVGDDGCRCTARRGKKRTALLGKLKEIFRACGPSPSAG